ncbi:potassium-transporting ATPase subunit F [Cohnella sp.]
MGWKDRLGRKCEGMTWALGILIVGVFGYLTYVLLHPQKF